MIEVLKQALEALESCGEGHITDGGNQWHDAKLVDTAITSLRQAIKELESQETVAWMDADGNVSDNNDHKCFPIPLYTHPPQEQQSCDKRTWVGLTDEEVEYPYPPAKPPVYATAENTKSVRDGYEMGGYEIKPGYYSEEQLDEFAKAIEAKLKEKNT